MSRARFSKTCLNEQIYIVESEDQDCVFPDQQPRYDPKELRDAVRILSPFVRLIDDTNNPFARIVAREVCKTFYHLFHCNIHPEDLIKTIDWKAKEERTTQLWNELWLYVPNQKIKEWKSLKKDKKNESFKFFNANNINEKIVLNKNSSFESQEKLCLQKKCCTNLYPKNDFKKQNEEISQCIININECSNDNKSEKNCIHQSGGYDPPSCAHSFNFNSNLIKYSSLYDLIEPKYFDNILNEQQENSKSKNLYDFYFTDPTGYENFFSEEGQENEEIFLEDVNNFRQKAGNDYPFMPNCQPSCSHDPVTDYSDFPNLYHYYTTTALRPSPQKLKKPIEPIVKTNCLNDVELDFEETLSSNGSCNSVKQNSFNDSLIALNNMNKTQKDQKGTQINNEKIKETSLCSATKTACSTSRKSSSCGQSVKFIRCFDDSEWNDNAFNDKDFIRILPFYQEVQNNLEYISNQQQEYGINMLDDIMSTLHHIHYELGDPRLKNDMLIEHVRLITRNTWENYFYRVTKKMPDIPTHPPLYPPSPEPQLQRTCLQESSPVRISSRQHSSALSCLRQSISSQKQTNTTINQPFNRTPVSLMHSKNDKEHYRPAINRPLTNCRVLPNKTFQNRRPLTSIQSNLRCQEQQRGGPKPWAPKLKAPERPKNFKEFKAKPLPKFIRDKLKNTNRNQCP